MVTSATITTLIKWHVRSCPGKRVLLDGFPRSLKNAHYFLDLCGKQELALHLDCDDNTISMERILNRAQQAHASSGVARDDDNIDMALKRYHRPTMEWLHVQHVPIVNLDCSGTPENVWNQLLAIGRLMRPAAKFNNPDFKGPTFLQ